jgi:hypothetical protein
MRIDENTAKDMARDFLRRRKTTIDPDTEVIADFEAADPASSSYNYDRWVVNFRINPGMEPDCIVIEIRDDNLAIRAAPMM